MMNGYYDFLGAVPPRVYSYSPPNVLTSLLHWRILAHLVLKLSPAAQGRLFGLHKQAFGKGPAQAPMATVSVPPPSPQVMPVAPPVQPMQCEPPRRVVPLAPLDSQFHRPQAPAIPSASRQSQACPRNQPVVPMAPPRQQQPTVNPPVRNQPVVPLAPLQQPRSNNQAVMPSAPQFQQGMEMVTSQAVPPAPSSSMPPSLPLAGMDAHFHLDRLYIKMRAKHHSNVSTSLWRRPPKISCEMTRCVPSYCFPEIWPTPEYLMGSLPAGADRFAMGWHPTRINDFFCPNKGYAFRSKFVQCLSLERCIMRSGRLGSITRGKGIQNVGYNKKSYWRVWWRKQSWLRSLSFSTFVTTERRPLHSSAAVRCWCVRNYRRHGLSTCTVTATAGVS